VKDVRIALGGVAHKPWRAVEGRSGAAGRAGHRGGFRAAAELELARAQPLRDNAFKVELATRSITAVLERTEGDESMSVIKRPCRRS
jgi:xanthine dehydrogenase YagS FAD-binding subunit